MPGRKIYDILKAASNDKAAKGFYYVEKHYEEYPMNEKSQQINNEIRLIARYRGLIISKYYFIMILSLITIYLSILRLAPSSLYILLIMVVMVPVLKSIQKEISIKHHNRFFAEFQQEIPFILGSLKQKYKYSGINSFANSTAYIIMCLLICLWQIRYSLSMDLNPYLRRVPFAILVTGVLLRFLSVIIYRIKLPHDVMYNKL